jgi:hypothetical protein
MTGVQVRRDSLPWSRPLLKPDRHGHSTPLSRPTCAPRATSSRVDSLFEPRGEIRGGDPPRIPRAARRVFARDPWIRHPAEWGAPPSPGKAGPPKRAGDVSKPNASRVRVLHIARYRRYASHGRAFTRSQVRTRRRLPGFSSCPRLASSLPNPPRGVLSSTHAAPETRVICERFANRGPDHASPRRGTARVIRRTTRADALTPLPHSALRSRPGPRSTN